ncbi:hypothetical protein HHI36_000627 [Cryptolaemus montrouzieri]|uniref:Uncharacterized protein n=1 Tax=Cryptolaemus montrouzieri TaxID=559131 RepID=A0ABD2P522_9CUCU
MEFTDAQEIKGVLSELRENAAPGHDQISVSDINNTKKNIVPILTKEVAGRVQQHQRRSADQQRSSTDQFPNADSEDEQLINIRHHLTRNLMHYKGMNPSSRPKILRMSQFQDMAEMMKKIDSLVNEHMSDVSNLDDLVDLVYSAAVTPCEIQGTMPIPEYVNAESNNAPPWQVRLEGKIVKLRKKIGHLHTI